MQVAIARATDAAALDPVDASIVRILDAADTVVGAGFLVSDAPDAPDALILTCAHVVDAALDRRGDISSEPIEPVRLNFPLVAPRETLTAQVACWQPARTAGGEDGLDVALLRLSRGAVPPGARPLPLVEDTDLWEHSFRAFGFPEGFPGGTWARGVVLGSMAGGLVQVVAEKTGQIVAPGFSGAPIWDGLAGGAVGMVVVSDEDMATRTAGMIPVEVLQKACPALRPVVSPPRELQQSGGPYDPRWYIARPEEERALAYLRNPGQPAVLWGPRSAGKSWMLQHLIERLQQEPGGPRHIVEMDLARYDPDVRNSFDALLQKLARRIVRAVGLAPGLVNEAWDPDTDEDSGDRLEWLLEKHVFPYLFPKEDGRQMPGQLVLAIERADAVWGYAAQDALFGMLRSWSERSGREPWSRLRLLLAVSTTPTTLSQGRHQSPFNVVPPVDLRDLSDRQVRALVQMYGLELSVEEFERLEILTKGHPHLVRLALFEAAINKKSLASVLDDRNLDTAFGWYVQGYWNWLEDQPGLLDAMRSALSSPRERLSTSVENTLSRAGLIE